MKNEKLALDYFRESAFGNYSDGQYNYGVFLMKQNPKEKDKALKYINTAAFSGHTLALFHLGM